MFCAVMARTVSFLFFLKTKWEINESLQNAVWSILYMNTVGEKMKMKMTTLV